MKNLIFCAIDTADRTVAEKLIAAATPHTGTLKLGLEFFCAHGPAGIQAVRPAGSILFLDLKLHDIPNTVAQALKALVPLQPNFITLHASGGAAMLQAARQAVASEATRLGIARPQLLGVTVLTSLASNDLMDVGQSDDVSAQVKRLAGLALNNGCDGIVCAATDVARLREQFGTEAIFITPGIRPADTAVKGDDQARTLTPVEAIKAGATHLVIGRPISQAADPATAVKAILASI